MEGFYIAVLSIATIILMLILTTLGVAMRKGNADVAWPPGDAAKCPIGWEAGTTLTQCKIPDAQLISGEIYSTYSSTAPLEPGYKENTGTADADWTSTVGAATYASQKFTVTVMDDIQARAFTVNRPIKIESTAGKIAIVDPVNIFKATYTYTTASTLTTSSSYNVYTSYVDAVKGVNSVGTGTTASTSATVLTFNIKPTVTLPATIYAVLSTENAISNAGISNVKTLTGTGTYYTPESKTVSFTVTSGSSAMTATGDIYFKKAYFDFNGATDTRCGKKVFAKKYNLTWDGVSEYNKC